MRYLTEQQMRLINQLVIRETGGALGVRDHHTLALLEELPAQTALGSDLYPGVFAKAAVYMRSIIMNHPFLDGNKRTGVACALAFLEYNGKMFEAKRGEIETFAVRIVTDRLELSGIATWLEEHCVKSFGK